MKGHYKMNFSWSSEYSVNNAVLDQHHQNLIKLFDDSYKILTENKSTTDTIMMISQLTTYSIFHFNEEERIMRSVNYPGLEKHIQEHKDFIAKIQEFKGQINDDSIKLKEDIFLFLYDWLISHIQYSDQKYVGYLK